MWNSEGGGDTTKLRDRKIRRQEENIGVTGREEDILWGWETGRQGDRSRYCGTGREEVILQS